MPQPDFFALNRDVILFVYGQVFFVMGLAIALQSRRYSRLDLARCLQWLAAFGIVHGVHEWGDLFIPLQATYLDQSLILALTLVHLATLGVSFALLFEFGMRLLRSLLPGRIGPMLRWLPLLVLIAWSVISVFTVLPLVRDFGEWQRITNALARYFIGFPAALMSAYGLRRHALERIAPLDAPQIVASLRIAGFALALYAVFGGLIVPPAPFFPANWLNTVAFIELAGVPVLVFRSLIGLVLAVTIIRALEVFNIETDRRIEAMEQQQILQTERDRIGRNLHDGAIQQVYTAGLLVESARNLAPEETPLASRLDRATLVLGEAIAMLRHSLGELRPSSTERDMALSNRLTSLGSDPRFTSFVDVSLRLDAPGCDSLAPVQIEHIVAVVNEALSNVVRHSHARKATVTVTCDEQRLRVLIEDDGSGLPEHLQAGYGLRNMRDRARLLGGALDVADAGRHGTIVTLDIPRSEET